MARARLRLAAALLAGLIALSPAGVSAAPARVGIAALALWSDPVFKSEATGAAAVLARRFGRGGPVVVRVNTPDALVTTPDAIRSAIRAAGHGLDPERDVLFVVLTTHGAPEGAGVKGGGRQGLIGPDELGDLLAASPVRRKVLIVSACFSGIDLKLAAPDTLVVTAADATHPSFGCRPEARWTYFGDALFNQALRRGGSLPEAFAEAKRIVAAREAEQGFEPSNPQIGGGEDVLPALGGE